MQGPDAACQLLQAAMGGDVTVATRNAFDAINNMFHGALDSQVCSSDDRLFIDCAQLQVLACSMQCRAAWIAVP